MSFEMEADMVSNRVIVEIVNEYRTMLQQQIALHLKRQRDHIVRMRRRFLSKLARRLHRNYILYDRHRRSLLSDVSFLNMRRREVQPATSRSRLQQPVPEQLHLFPASSEHEFTEEQLERFRINHATFQCLYDQLEHELEDADCEPAMTARMRMGVALYVLGTGKDFESAATLFHLHSRAVRASVHLFCGVVNKLLRDRQIDFPHSRNHIRCGVKEFEELVGIPQVFGAIGCLHIPVERGTVKDAAKYINSKGWSSIILQAIVDSRGRFLDVSCEHPGHTNAADMLINSSIYQRMEQLDGPCQKIDKSNVLPLLLGDGKYPLLPWLITPYLTTAQMTPAERSFNVYAAKGRACIVRTFERLVGRWKALNRCSTMVATSCVPEIILTCCILHNIAEQNRSPYKDAWSECHNEEDVAPEQPHWECQITSMDGEEVRNRLSKFMHERFPLIVDDD
ncbi:protein ALP1-like [Anopheles merus]|uniref:protein ALP1-like n=1 Tax=Anopheles merus TaxID=30066 RepID=UPI001BE41DA1|nr:protein ALP1-like [Anopheles merus]